MSETRFTPGPWELTQQYLGMGTCTLGTQIWQQMGYRIAFTEGQNVGASTELANARLIAAAPDLYAALESILQYCAPLSEQQDQSRLSAFAALAKARGEY